MAPLLLLLGLLYAKAIPGVPAECCGTLDCRPASVQVLRRGPVKSEVLVDGMRLAIPTGRVPTATRSYYCYQWWKTECGTGEVISEKCVICAVEAGVFASAELLPRGHGKWLVLPTNQDCGNCHGGKGGREAAALAR